MIMATDLWRGTATFRQGSREKVGFLFLQGADLGLTCLALSLGLVELNPVMAYLVTVPLLLLVVKVFVPLLIAWVVPGRLLLPAIMVLALVVGWNLKELWLQLL